MSYIERLNNSVEKWEEWIDSAKSRKDRFRDRDPEDITEKYWFSLMNIYYRDQEEYIYHDLKVFSSATLLMVSAPIVLIGAIQELGGFMVSVILFAFGLILAVTLGDESEEVEKDEE